MQRKDLIAKLFEVGVVKRGNFTLKSGAQSSIYIDLRLIVSYPAILASVANHIWQQIAAIPTELICGVPYTALPIATCISLEQNIPMVLRRKEAKNYGTKKMIEGVYQAGQSCLIIEDVITTASSVIETLDNLTAEGLKVSQVVCLVDREQGGREALAQRGCQLRSVFTLRDLETCQIA